MLQGCYEGMLACCCLLPVQVVDIAVNSNMGHQQLVAACGRGPRSYATCLDEGMPLDELAFTELSLEAGWLGHIPVSSASACCCCLLRLPCDVVVPRLLSRC